MVQKERTSLSRIKPLLTKLSGDETWIPCENVETENDIAFFQDAKEKLRSKRLEKLTTEDADLNLSGILILQEAAKLQVAGERQLTEVAPSEGNTVERSTDVDTTTVVVTENAHSADDTLMVDEDKTEDVQPTSELENNVDINSGILDGVVEAKGKEADVNSEIMDGIEGEDLPAPHRMRTRAQAQAASDNTPGRTQSATPDSSFGSRIHPFFIAPESSHPNRDLGLPPTEAEETRRLLQLYIQKQEEVCRGAERIYNGLLKADRCRKLVMEWAKAEAHVGVNRDMSDGEDWYDKEKWGLTEDLKKGENEEDEDPATVAKKTRTRRQ
jgi:hypothetical protein